MDLDLHAVGIGARQDKNAVFPQKIARRNPADRIVPLHREAEIREKAQGDPPGDPLHAVERGGDQDGRVRPADG